MDYTILLNEDDKSLITTKYVPIFQYENNPCKFKFIIPQNYSSLSPILQIILPDKINGKIMSCVYEPELYKNRFVIYANVPNILTQLSGRLKLWITFMSEDQNKTIKTDYLYVDIMEHEGFNGIETDGEYDDIITKLSKLETEVSYLDKTKANILTISDDNKKLILKSSDAVLSSINLPDNVTWEIL